jgi:hypothetical protein
MASQFYLVMFVLFSATRCHLKYPAYLRLQITPQMSIRVSVSGW